MVKAVLNPKSFMFSMFGVLIVSLATLIVILQKVDPQENGFFGLLVFYVTFFLLSAAVFAIFGYVVRVFLTHNSPLHNYATISLRQGLLLAFFLTTLLFLQSLRSLTLLSVGLLVVSLILLEIAFLTR